MIGIPRCKQYRISSTCMNMLDVEDAFLEGLTM